MLVKATIGEMPCQVILNLRFSEGQLIHASGGSPSSRSMPVRKVGHCKPFIPHGKGQKSHTTSEVLPNTSELPPFYSPNFCHSLNIISIIYISIICI